jgi:hypothetical protein
VAGGVAAGRHHAFPLARLAPHLHWLVQNGTQLYDLQEMGGWKPAEMVRRYARLAPAQMAKHVAVVGALLPDTNTAQEAMERTAAKTKKGLWASEPDLYRPSGFLSELRAATKQKAHEREFVGLILIRGRPCGIRTCDQRIKSPLLYQLS